MMDPPAPRRREAPPPEHWHRIEELLDAALELPPDERVALLDRACADDPALREALERLLRAHERAGDFLETPAADFATPFLPDPATLSSPLTAGTRVGPYRVVREVGRGGMGAVYLAERDDGEYRKQVALKVVAGVWALDDELLGRFRDERQILASLEHPGIARMIDGGVTDNGLPYLIMEYVEGVPVDRYCDDHELTMAARLALFCAVCDAVEHAHRKCIVHRDLKPSNILVDDADPSGPDPAAVQPPARVKLLDFGIAQMVDPASVARAEHTRPGLRRLTPEYASPEQIRGEDVTPASDVYSLGVLLYRLLTGRSPYGRPGPGLVGIERLVLETWPEPPSLAVGRAQTASDDPHGTARTTPEEASRVLGSTPDRLRRQLRGDLDAIALKALAKEPEQRYGTAGDLAADVRRHLDGRPAVARGRGRLALVRAFARRHPVPVTVGVVAALGLAVAAVWASRPTAQSTLASDSVIAVLPFAPAVPDTALQRLGRDLAVTLSANLDGVGEFRTIDIQPVLARQTGDHAGERAVETARRVGAGAIVRGRLVRVGDLVRADAALFIGHGIDPAARASVTAPPDALAALTDSLAWTLLREVWRTGSPPTPSLEAITTPSLPALRAFLDGERLMMEARYAEAIQAFGRAIESDSTFWYAYWRYARASESIERAVEPRIVEAYLAHRSAFPLRERLLIEAQMTDSMSVYLARVPALAERFREYWPAWWDYANRLVHDGALYGYTHAEARAALERTVNLNPGLDAAWSHLFWLAAADGDALVAERSLRELTRLRADRGTDGELRFYRYVHHLMRSNGRIDAALADSVARDAVEFGPDPRPEWFDQGLLRYGFAEATIDWAKRVFALDPPDPLAAATQRAIAGAWAARGAWESALVVADRYADGTADPAAALYAYRLAVVGLWAGGVDAVDVQRRRAALAPVAERLGPQPRSELAWLDGVVAATLQDPGGLAAARVALRQLDALAAPLLDRSLRAFELVLQGNGGEAARTLVELERARGDHGSYRRLSDAHPYLTAVNRLTASRLLLALGDTTTAAGLLVFHEGVPWPLPLTGHANYILAGPAYLERARIEEAAGRNDIARTYYNQFLRRYDAPVPAHRPMRDGARAAIARLAEP
ncbi:MAG TPA: serine/threonine-protein kinase [Longimicrobiales bacterium]|nr:serine/threonine-protein kinase [Longimicrobiales bacterium]